MVDANDVYTYSAATNANDVILRYAGQTIGPTTRTVTYSVDVVLERLGVDVHTDTIDAILKRLGVVVNGTGNQILNGDFETGDFTGWLFDVQSNPPIISTSSPHSGTYCVDVNQNEDFFNSDNGLNWGDVGTGPYVSTISSLGFWYKNTGTDDAGVIVYFYDETINDWTLTDMIYLPANTLVWTYLDLMPYLLIDASVIGDYVASHLNRYQEVDIWDTLGASSHTFVDDFSLSTGSYSIDTKLLYSSFLLSYYVDVLFQRLGIDINTNTIDTILERLEIDTNTYYIDALFQRLGIDTNTDTIDTLLKRLEINTNTYFVDAELILKPIVNYYIDVLFQKFGVDTHTDTIDTVLERLGIIAGNGIEKILNGGFESDEDDWVFTYGAISTDNPHSGSKCAVSYFNSEFGGNIVFIDQTFATPISIALINSFKVWVRSTESNNLNVGFFVDGEEYDYAFTDNTSDWKQYNLKDIMISLGLTSGNLQKIRFNNLDETTETAIDDVSLSIGSYSIDTKFALTSIINYYIDVFFKGLGITKTDTIDIIFKKLGITIGGGGSAEKITNGGFEYGNLTGWTVPQGSANVITSSPHTGNYAVTVHGGYGMLRQTFSAIPADLIQSITVWYRTTVLTGAVVIMYGDNTTSDPYYCGTITGEWNQLTISEQPSDRGGIVGIELVAGMSGDCDFDDISLIFLNKQEVIDAVFKRLDITKTELISTIFKRFNITKSLNIDTSLLSLTPPVPTDISTLLITNPNGTLWCKPISWKETQDCMPAIRPLPLAESEYLDADTWVLKPRTLEVKIRLSDREKKVFEAIYGYASITGTNLYSDFYLSYNNSAYIWHYIAWINSKDYKFEYSMENGRYVRWWTVTLTCDILDFSGSDATLPSYDPFAMAVTIDSHKLDFILDFERTDKHPPMLPEWINQREAVDSYIWNECVLDVAYTGRMTNAEKWLMDITLRNHTKVIYEDYIHNLFSIQGGGVWVSSIEATWDDTNWEKPWKVAVAIQANNSEIESRTGNLILESSAYPSGTNNLGTMYLDELPNAQGLPSLQTLDVGVHTLYFYLPTIATSFHDWQVTGGAIILDTQTFGRESILTVIITGNCTINARYDYPYVAPTTFFIDMILLSDYAIDLSYTGYSNPCNPAKITIGGVTYNCPYTIREFIGAFSSSASAGSGDNTHIFDHWITTGGVTVDDEYSSSTTMHVTDNGTLNAVFHLIEIVYDSYSITSVCDVHQGKIGTISYWYTPLPQDISGNPTGSWAVGWDPDSSGRIFDHWVTTGGVTVDDIHSQVTTMNVTDSGTLTAAYSTPSEQIINGGFESPLSTGWTVDTGTVARTSYSAHSGSYKLQFFDKGTNPINGSVHQNISNIAVNSMSSFTLWYQTTGINTLTVVIDYSDATNTTISGLSHAGSYIQLNILSSLTAGKTVTAIHLIQVGVNTGTYIYVDDVSLLGSS